MKEPRKEDPPAAAPRLAPVDLAIAAGLSAGSIDVSLAIVARSPALGSAAGLIPPMAASAFAVFALSLAAILAVFTLRRRSIARGETFPVAVVTFIVVLFVVLDYGHTAPFPRNPFRLLVAAGVAAAAGILAARPPMGPRFARMVTTLPPVLLVITAFAWLFHYRAGASISAPGVLTGAACAVALLAVVEFVRRVRGPAICSSVGCSCS